MPGGHDQRGQPGSHKALCRAVQRLEDVAVPEYGSCQLQRHVRAQRGWQLPPKDLIISICAHNQSHAAPGEGERCDSTSWKSDDHQGCEDIAVPYLGIGIGLP